MRIRTDLKYMNLYMLPVYFPRPFFPLFFPPAVYAVRAHKTRRVQEEHS